MTKLTITELAEWREKFQAVDGTPQMKVFAKSFRNEFDLWKLKDHQIYELLRESDEFFQLLKEAINDDDNV